MIQPEQYNMHKISQWFVTENLPKYTVKKKENVNISLRRSHAWTLILWSFISLEWQHALARWSQSSYWKTSLYTLKATFQSEKQLSNGTVKRENVFVEYLLSYFIYLVLFHVQSIFWSLQADFLFICLRDMMHI